MRHCVQRQQRHQEPFRLVELALLCRARNHDGNSCSDSSESASVHVWRRPWHLTTRFTRSRHAHEVEAVNEADTFALTLLAVLFVGYVLPVLWVLLSGRSHGGAKFGWFLVTVFFSWVGLAAFLIFTQSASDRRDA